MIWRAPDHRHHQDNYMYVVGFYVGAHGYHRLNTAQGAYTRSWDHGISLSFSSFSSSLFPICRDLVSPDSQSINPFSTILSLRPLQLYILAPWHFLALRKSTE